MKNEEKTKEQLLLELKKLQERIPSENSSFKNSKNIHEVSNNDLTGECQINLKNIVDASPVPQFIIDQKHRIIHWNYALEKYSGITEKEVLGTNQQWRAFYNNERPCLADLLVESAIDKIEEWYGGKYHPSKLIDSAFEAVDFFPDMLGGVWLYFTAATIHDDDGTILGAVETLTDITEERKAEDQLRKSLFEKELLLKEIHHRVKNNMQIISSLLSLQSQVVTDPKYKNLFIENQNRVKSMATVHEKLYLSPDFSNIDFKEYVQSLITEIFIAYNVNPEKIKVMVDIRDITIGMDTAVPCGLILNELLVNSIKHAFPEGQGEILIELHSKNNMFTLIFSDDGVGFSSDIDFDTNKTLGLQLIKNLVKQLEGNIELDKSKGTKYTIKFKDIKYENRLFDVDV